MVMEGMDNGGRNSGEACDWARLRLGQQQQNLVGGRAAELAWSVSF